MTDMLKINIPEGTSLDQRCIALLSAMKDFNQFQQAKLNLADAQGVEREKLLAIYGSIEDMQFAEQVLVSNLKKHSAQLSEKELEQAKNMLKLTLSDYRMVLSNLRIAELTQNPLEKENYLDR